MRDLHETLSLIREGKMSVREHWEEVSDRLATDEEINSFITLDREGVERDLKQTLAGPLAGALVGIKDNIQVKGLPMTCGSKMLRDYVSVYDADVTLFLKQAGALIPGKLNMDEFAMGSSNETSAFGAVKNPLDHSLVPGGSSGGSAAAVRAGFCDVALGTDTGGSVRQPACFCGVVGFKPTYGAISRYGVASLANTLDTVGTLARSVRDAYLVFRTIAGDTKKDMTKIHVEAPALPASYDEAISSLKGRKIALLKNVSEMTMEPAVKEAYDRSIRALTDAGVHWVEVRLDTIRYAVGCYYAIVGAESSGNLSRYDGIRYAGRKPHPGETVVAYMSDLRGEGFGDEVKRRILSGMFMLSGPERERFYRQALCVRRAVNDEYAGIFEQADALFTPTSIGLAFPLGTKIHDPSKMMQDDILTVPVNLAGLPAISVPAAEDGLCAGMQWIAARGSDGMAARLAMAYEGLVKSDARSV